MALGELFELADTKIRELVQPPSPHLIKPLGLSNTTRETIRDCIEHSSGEARERLVEIVQIFQILEARIKSNTFSKPLLSDISSPKDKLSSNDYNQIGAIHDWLCFLILTSHLFRFARGLNFDRSRDQVGEEVVQKMEQLDRNGWLYTNIEQYRKLMDAYEQNSNIGFANKLWANR